MTLTQLTKRLPTTWLPALGAHLRTPLYRNAYALIANQGLSAMLGILFWMLAARLYTPEQVGRDAALITALLFLAFAAQLGLKSAMTWVLPRAGAATLRYIWLAYATSMAMAGLLGAAAIFGLRGWLPTLRELSAQPVLALWFVGSAMVWCVFAIQDGVLTGLRQPIWVTIENAIYNLSKLALLVGLAGLPGAGVWAAWTLPVAPVVLIVNFLIMRRLAPRHIAAASAQASPPAPRQVVRFVAGDYLGALFSEVATKLLPLLVIGALGSRANAYFYQAWSIALPLLLIASNMTASLTVEATSDSTKRALYSRRMLRQMVRLIIPAALALALGARPILSLYGAAYAEAGAGLLRLLALAAIPYILYAWYISHARIHGRVWGIVLIQALLCALTLGLSSWLLPLYGINGVGIAWLATQLVLAALIVFTQLRPALRAPAQARPASQNELLRRADWRFLLAQPAPGRSVCYAPGLLRAATANVSRELVAPAQAAPGSCDLAVAADPSRAVLAQAYAALAPGGACYTEWAGRRLGGPACIRRRLAAAGFTNIQCYWRWPAAAPRAWLPLGSTPGPLHYLVGQLLEQRRLGSMLHGILVAALRWGLKLGLLGPICVTARRPGGPAEQPMDLPGALRAEELAAAGGPGPDRWAVLLLTGGQRALNKLIGLVFCERERTPRLVLKLPRVADSVPALEREAAVLRGAQALEGASERQIPRVLFCDAGWGVAWLGQTTLTGTPLRTLVRPASFQPLALQATDWLIDLAGPSQPSPRAAWWGRLVAPLLAEIELLYGPVIDPQRWQESCAILAALGDLPLVCAHRDFTPWNVLAHQGRLAVFDWESADLQGLPLLDLLYFLANLAFCCEGTLGTGRECDTYRVLLDPATAIGAVAQECIARYCRRLAIGPAQIRALRVLLWLLHARLEYDCLRTDAGAPPSAERLRASLCIGLWEADLRIA